MGVLVVLGWILIAIAALVILLLAVVGGFFIWYMFLKEGAEGPKIFKAAWEEGKS